MRLNYGLPIFLLLCSAFVISIFAGFGVSEKIETSEPQVLSAKVTRPVFEDSFIDKINSLRASQGLGTLVIDSELTKVAEIRSQDMINRSYYAHVNPDGLTYDVYLAGEKDYSCENLNLSESFSLDETVDDWLNSPRHKDCLLNAEVSKIGYSNGILHDSMLTTLILSN